jgi:Tfp pilus assembly protein PilF
MRPNHLVRLSCLMALPALCFGQAKKQPLTRSEILGRLAIDSSRSSVARLVKLRGVNFSPDSSYLALISRAGGNGILYKRLSEATVDDSASAFTGGEPSIAHLAKCAEFGQLGDFKTAETECRAAISENPASPWPLIATLHAFAREGDKPADSEALARRAVALAPNQTEAHQYLATTLRTSGQQSDSQQQELYSELTTVGTLMTAAMADDPMYRLPPDSGGVPGGFSDAQLRNPAGMEAEFERQTALDPDFAPTHALASAYYHSISKPDHALQEMQKALELEPDNAEYHSSLGSLFGSKDEREAEIAEYREAIRCEPFSSVYRINLAESLSGLGRMEDALREFDDLIAMRPANWEVDNTVTDFLVQQHRLPVAIADIRKFLKATTDGRVEGFFPVESPRLERQQYLARLLQLNGELDESATEFLDILRSHPDDADVHNDYGNVLAAQGKMDEAAAEYSEALRIDPSMSAAHNNLALCMARKNQMDGAIGEFRSALEANPQEPHTRSYLGFAYASKGNFESAITELKKAIEENPKDAEPHDYLGRTYLLKKDEASAIGEFGKALELDPDNAMTENEIAWLYATAANVSLRDPRASLEHVTHAVALLQGTPQAQGEAMGAVLDTLAEAQLLNGHAAEALINEEKALRLAPNNPDIKGRIQRFRDAASLSAAKSSPTVK